MVESVYVVLGKDCSFHGLTLRESFFVSSLKFIRLGERAPMQINLHVPDIVK